jgi:hypothetical protein
MNVLYFLRTQSPANKVPDLMLFGLQIPDIFGKQVNLYARVGSAA